MGMAGPRGPGGLGPFCPRNHPLPCSRSCLAGSGLACIPPFPVGQVGVELDLPASRGCCAAAATSATAALRRRRRAWEAAPRESPAGRGQGRRGRLPYLPRPVPDPWGRVTAGAQPYLPGAAQTLSGSGKRRDSITYLSRVAWFPRGRCGGGRVCCSLPKGAGALQPGGVGCGCRVGGLRIFIGVGLRRRVYHISPGSHRPQELARLWAGVGWVGSALLMNAAV